MAVEDGGSTKCGAIRLMQQNCKSGEKRESLLSCFFMSDGATDMRKKVTRAKRAGRFPNIC